MHSFQKVLLALLYILAESASARCTYSASPSTTTRYLTCGKAGGLLFPRQISKFASNAGLTPCIKACLDNSKCATFSYDSTSRQCATYSTYLLFQGWIPFSRSSVQFWSAQCYTKTCTTDSVSSVSSQGSTTTATDSGSTVQPPDFTPTTHTGDPNETPTDPSAFTATYTYYESYLPTFTDPAPTLTGLTQETEAPKCMADPSDSSVKFEIIDDYGTQLVYQTGNPPRIGALRLDQIQPQTEAALEAYKFPQFHFEKPSNAPMGYYDLVMEDPTRGNFYLGRDTTGTIFLLGKSSNGQTPATINGKQAVTTIWGVSCEGFLAVGTSTATYAWQPSGQYTVAKAAGATAARPYLLNPKASISKRNNYQDGTSHRCLSQPRVLVADVRPGARPAHANGCGSDNSRKYVPQLDFEQCCNGHDYCYDDCVGGFRDTCDNNFLTCMKQACDDNYSSINVLARWGCKKVAGFYYDVVHNFGDSPFQSCTNSRCQCYCNDRQNNQLCSVNGSPSCIQITGNDNNNCGGCGQQCGQYAHCNGGKCACNQDTCPGGLCLDLLRHPRNCGYCGNVCDSKYCNNGYCYTPPPPSPTSCSPADVIAAGGFNNYAFDGWSWSGATGSSGVSPDENNADWPRAYATSGNWPVTLSQAVTVCAGSQYTLTMMAYSWSGNCKVTASLAGHNFLTQNVPYRESDASPLGAVGPAKITIDANDNAYTRWGVSRNATFQLSFDCAGAYTTVYVDDISLYPG